MRKQVLSFGLGALLLLSGGPRARAQQPDPVKRAHPEHTYGFRCAFDSAQQAAFARTPGSERNYRNFLLQMATLSAQDQARLLAQPDVTVPVVVHVIHTGGANNISDAQVQDAIRILNEDYSKTNPDTADVIAAFRPRYANIGFRFRLARRDPNGNCTTGITRTFSTQTSIGDDKVKNLITWDQDRYLNIWVCDAANGAGGYAYLPCSGGAADGIVIRNQQFASIGRSCGSNFCNRSLTHEVGHYFGLPHTWGGSNTPGLASNCGLDDGIADTPNTVGVGAPAGGSGCPLTSAPCGELANVQNYMDYASCAKMFTTGQKTVMRGSLLLSCRSTLTSAANLIFTGTNDGYSPAPCAPVVVFQPSSTVVCEGSAITFSDQSYNADLTAPTTQYQWQFPGGQPASSTLRQPTVTYPVSGVYGATLTITTPGGTGTSTRAQLIQVQGANTGLQGPVVESFETPGFPANFPAPDLRNWTSSSTSTAVLARWERQTSAVASQGAAYLQIRNSLLATGTNTNLTSPNLNLSSISGPAYLVFDRAYARRSATANDQLRVQFSADCGVSWTTATTYFAANLSTKGSQFYGGFVPDSLEEWQPLTVSIPDSYKNGRFQVRLQMVSNGGNTLFIDNLRVGNAAVLAARSGAGPAGIYVYPSPLTSASAVHFRLAAPGPVQLVLTDVLGRPVRTTAPRAYGAGEQQIALTQPGQPPLAPGLYVVRLLLNGQTFSTKVLVQ
ncbi:T9SS type A sorting domain-containing protein [Hymenobacter aquaticus]|uniref:T9SS type A sorting domain-containing protein n=1 Tax=Hymenobacter aquaticus TaxID=1867101 RepID=A0A4Z0Q492_9BACT|nr:M43 family zinc metalloprotease [Hymenobacter aquaticus]TGE24296.1 T9SS type A sorting domain-containing protein [Hymenobacter aquaticus]